VKGILITYALTYGGAAVGLFNPYLGLLAYVALSILKPEFLWGMEEGSYSRIVAIALLIGWAFRGFGNWNFGRARYVVLALLAYWIWSMIAALFAVDKEEALIFIEQLTKIILPFLVGVTRIDNAAKLRQLAWVILLAEGYVAMDMNLSYYSGYNRLQEDGFGGMDNNCNGVAFVACLGLGLFLALSSKRWWQKGLSTFFALALAHCTFIAFSRGAMLGLIITGLVSFIVIPKKPRHYLLFAIILLVILRLAGKDVRERFSSTFDASEKERDGSAGMRLKHWKACLQSIGASPLVGVGPMNWHLVSPQYSLPRMEAHTTWLQTGAEIGIPGVLALLLFYVVCTIRLWPIARQRWPVPDPWLHDGARMVIASLCGFLVSSQFVTMGGLEVPYYVVILGAGVLKLTTRPSTAPGVVPLQVDFVRYGHLARGHL
jgi:O-antigen ligase